MGFDISISLELQICNKTGRPFLWTPTSEKLYDINLADYTVPPELYKYARGRGSIYYAYTEHFNTRDVYDTSVDSFLEEFPSWDDVSASDVYEDYEQHEWNEEDHNKFKALLEWCSKQAPAYRISWSY
jgi:hypothetical protein